MGDSLYTVEFLDSEIGKLEERNAALRQEIEAANVKITIYRELRSKLTSPAQLDPGSHPDTTAKRLRAAKAIHDAGGRMKAGDVATASGVLVGSVTDLLEHPWFAKLTGNRQAPYVLTEAGKRAVKAAGV